MGVYIKNMEMPKDCIVCPFGWNGCNKQHDFVYMGRRPVFCPLIDVHEPHGRLIDEYVLIGNAFNGEQNLYCWDDIEKAIDSTPTIIEAEEES